MTLTPIERPFPEITVHWDAARTERALGGARRKLARARHLRAVGGVAAAALSVACWFWLVRPLSVVRRAPVPSIMSATASAVVSPKRVEFPDGSLIDLVGERSNVQVRSVSDSRIEVELAEGRARFQVTAEPQRQFSVRAGTVVVDVVGTEFTLDVQERRTEVSVRAGKVRVSWPGGEVLLEPGARETFPLAGTAVAPPAPADSSRAVDAAERFRAHARARDYASAYRLLATTPTVVGNGATDLMLAADVARLSGHPADAIPYLERVIREHRGSGQAPLAAFTLGRVLSGMGQAERAMEAFALVSTLSPKSPLGEDALARQTEMAYRGGDRVAARRLAEQYLASYPAGRRRAAVARFGGLE
jgi:transmembrane sensor